MDHPKKTRPVPLTVHSSRQEVSAESCQQEVSTKMQEVQVQVTKPVSTLILKKPGMNKLVTSKEQILTSYPDVLKGIGKFPGSPYHIKVDPNIMPKQTSCRPVPVHLKGAFREKMDKMLKAGIIKPVHEATPWINSFMFVAGKEKSDNIKLCICLDPTTLTKVVIRESYHFKTPEDIAHLIADSCVMTVCNGKKGYWHQELDEASSSLTTFNAELGRFRYNVMPFGITVIGDVFQ